MLRQVDVVMQCILCLVICMLVWYHELLLLLLWYCKLLLVTLVLVWYCKAITIAGRQCGIESFFYCWCGIVSDYYRQCGIVSLYYCWTLAWYCKVKSPAASQVSVRNEHRPNFEQVLISYGVHTYTSYTHATCPMLCFSTSYKKGCFCIHLSLSLISNIS